MKNDFFKIIRGGLNSTFQDKGRKHLYHIGIPFSGAMDRRNYLIANRLIDNDKEDAVLECSGPSTFSLIDKAFRTRVSAFL